MTAVSFVSASAVVLNGTTDRVTGTLPATVQDGDGIYAVIWTDTDLTGIPPGWASLGASSPQWDTGTSTIQVWLAKKSVVTAADSGASTGEFVRTAAGLWTIMLYQVRSSTGTLAPQTPSFNWLDPTDYTIAVPTQTAAVDGEMWIVGAQSKLFTTAPISYPALTMDLDPAATTSGHQLVGHVSENAGAVSSSLDNFVMQAGTSGANALIAFILRIQPTGSDPAPRTAIDGDLSDTLRSSDLVVFNTRVRPAIVDSCGVAEVFSTLMGKLVHDTLGLQAVPLVIERMGLTTSDSVQIASQLLAGYPKTITEGLGAHEVLTAAYAARMVEKLGLQSLLVPNARYGLSLVERLRLADALRRFFAAEVIEALGLQDALTAMEAIRGLLVDGLGLNDALDQQMILRVTAHDDIHVEPEQLLQMVFAGKLVDGLQVAALYVEPSGSMTTWAVNTRTSAVTQYSNYNFNSFAATGHKYLGASSDGLYELDGDTDAGTPVIAHIKGGFMQFGQMHMSSIKGIYLGIRGAGDFVLKVETGDKKVYVYGLKARDFETTRVRPGKGLRARFFRFELISTGQDFDLEAIEFIPLVATRRG